MDKSKPEPDAEAPAPFVETDAEASLRRIAEAGRERRASRDALIAAKAAYKAAKQEYEKACEEEKFAIDSETTELPLFPRANPDAAKKPPAKGRPATPGETWLSEVGLNMSLVVKLGEHGLQTVEDVGRFTEGGGSLASIRGVGESGAEKILAALERHWKSRKADDAA